MSRPSVRLEIKKIGEETVVILTDELLRRHGLEIGSFVHAVDVDGGIALLTTDQDSEEQIEAAKASIARYGPLYKRLSKL